MPKEHHHPHEGDFGHSSPWPESHHPSPHTHSPAHEYGFGFLSAHSAAGGTSPYGMPMDPSYGRSHVPMYTSAPAQTGPVALVAAQWPSMLTNPSSSQPPLAPTPAMPAPPTLAPVPSFAAAHSLPPLSTPPPPPSTSSRRTLTDQDRRKMCQYHEDNPTVKQTEIGGMRPSCPRLTLEMLTFHL